MKFKCPYCTNKFKSLQALATHLGVCKESTGEYVVSRTVGLLHYSIFNNKSCKDIIKENPNLTASRIRSFVNTFNKRGVNVVLLPEKTYNYYACPYCGAYAKKGGSLFKSWKGVSIHASKCDKNSNKYYFNDTYGPISLELFNSYSSPYIKTLYPKLGMSPKAIRQLSNSNYVEWRVEELLEKANYFYNEFGRFPISKDYQYNSFYPSVNTIYKFFSSWEEYINVAGLPYCNNGYGIPTLALDKHKYRSVLEATFVNKFLFSVYDYVIEPKYPNSAWLYDWYIPKIDLYIELAGGLRKSRIKEKIKINKLLKRDLLVVTPDKINKYDNLKEMIKNEI